MVKTETKQKVNILAAMPRRAQEEIVGFSMIILLVAVILLIFLSFSVKSQKQSTVESYEVESFLQALIQKTSSCGSIDNLRYYSIKELMFKCYSSQTSADKCSDGEKICDVFLEEMELVSNESWNPGVGKDFPVQGYSLKITVDSSLFKSIEYGNKTKSSKGSFQELAKEGKTFRLDFQAYY